ncbi:hypothetical protein PIB30_058776 [Stylosanthes scabra]|uniref:Uncharacterized protein n=1 Tax=Stylosanthes scabra TaxID=79078 RepID=A0ABU6UM55_9FABA|nr:hypothetical protein [Stylosanthes scabra]
MVLLSTSQTKSTLTRSVIFSFLSSVFNIEFTRVSMPSQNKCSNRTDTEPVTGPAYLNELAKEEQTNDDGGAPPEKDSRRPSGVGQKLRRRRFGGRHWQASSDGCAEAGAQTRGCAEAGAEKNEVPLRRPEKKDSQGLPEKKEARRWFFRKRH